MTPWTETLWKRVKRIHEQDQIRSTSDSELLERFIDSRDEVAYEELLRRYGPLVWGVCLRTLGQTPEAEDAFQAVFLILVRKAGQIQHRSQVAGWLYGTAQKVVRRSRQQRTRFAARHRQSEASSELGQEDELPLDWLPLLDRAVQKLPEKYREVLILCELQQRSRAEVARLLRLNQNTLSSRLARAKEMLRVKLAPTGLALPAGLVSVSIVPSALHSATLQLSLKLVAHAGSWSRIVPATLLPLVQGGSKLMFISKWLIGLAVGVVVTLGLMRSDAVPQQKAKADGAEKRAVQAEERAGEAVKQKAKGNPTTTVGDLQKLQGRWRAKAKTARGDFEDLSEIWFRGKELWFTFAKGKGPCVIATFSLGETFDPRRIDIHLGDPRSTEKELHFFGVYAFSSNDELTLRLGSDRSARPNLEEERDKVHDIFLERLMEPVSPLSDDIKELLGHWKVTSALADGKPIQEGILSLEFTPTRLLWEISGPEGRGRDCRLFIPFDYKLISSRNPRWINLEVIKEMADGQLGGPGIYSVTGDTLTLAFSSKDIRPSEFESVPDNDIYLITAKRIAQKTPDEDAKDPPIDPGVIEWREPKIELPFELSDAVLRENKSLILWVSYDLGESFEKYAEKELPSTSSHFDFEARRAGEVQFAVQTVNRQGLAYPPSDSLKSQLKVRFELPKPTPTRIPPLKIESASVTKHLASPPTERLQKENHDLRQELDELKKRIEQIEKSGKLKK